MNNEELYEEVVALHKVGYGSRRIAKILNVDRKSFERWIYPRGTLCKPRPEPDLTPTPELSYLIGARLGDGFVYRSKVWRKYIIALRAKDKDFVEKFRDCLVQVSRRKVCFFQVSEGYWHTQTNSKPLYLWLKSKDVFRYNRIIKQFPAEFIRGVADSEGCVVILKGKYNYVYVDIANTDLKLLKCIQTLLWSYFQIASYIRLQCVYMLGESKKSYYRLEIRKQLEVAKFAISIGFVIKRKATKLNTIYKIQKKMLCRHELYRNVLGLHKQSLGYRRIAKRLKMPRGTVESWIARGHKPWGYSYNKTV